MNPRGAGVPGPTWASLLVGPLNHSERYGLGASSYIRLQEAGRPKAPGARGLARSTSPVHPLREEPAERAPRGMFERTLQVRRRDGAVHVIGHVVAHRAKERLVADDVAQHVEHE